jgi:hypothetical protein
MDKESMGYIHNGVLFIHKEELNHIFCRKMGGTGDHHVKENKSDSEKQIPHVSSHMQNLELKKWT